MKIKVGFIIIQTLILLQLASYVHASDTALVKTSGTATSQSVTDKLASDPAYSLFTNALQQTNLWELLRSQSAVSLFVPSNLSMQIEGSDFLLKSVMLAPENKARLQALLSRHLVLEKKLPLKKPYSEQSLTTHAGGCLYIQPVGEGLKIAADAYLIDHYQASNGVIVFVDRLLWSPYNVDDICVGNKG